jgi:perosamine synthetase
MIESINELTLRETQNLKEALLKVDKNAKGFCFVIDEDQILIGLLTDGDIRRAVLNNISLDAPTSSVMNRNFFSLPFDSDNITILKHISDKIKIIPLLDTKGRIVDYATIKKVHKIPVASPVLDGNELSYVTECIQTNWISSQGKFVMQFEKQFEDYHKISKALAVSNGTVAIHLALVALGIKEGDEIIVPDFTFAASINAIIHSKATPVIVDIDRDTWNICPKAIEKAITPRTRAIMPVHLYGYPCDMSRIMFIAKKHNLLVIEDCAEALGSYYKGAPVGSFGDASTFSFFGNKTVTTGEGGMVLFKDSAIGCLGAMLRDHGMSKTRRYWHEFVGFNYRMTNLQAAIGVAQMEKLDFFVERKQWIAKAYTMCLEKIGGFKVPLYSKDVINSYWIYTFIVLDNLGISRDEVIDKLASKGIETRPVFYPLHMMPPYKNFGSSDVLQNSIWVSSNGLSLPSSASLTEKELDYICTSITEIIAEP